MPINTAVDYSPMVVDAFGLDSVTNGVLLGKYDWTSAKSVVLTSNATSPLAPYVRTGVNRFGVPAELDNTQQTLTLAKDEGFTYSIDRRGREERALTIEAGSSLRNQVRLVVTPTVDKYRIAAIAAAALAIPAQLKTSAITKATAYADFLALQEILDEGFVPQPGRVIFATTTACNLLKQDTAFVKSGDLSQTMLVNGQFGEMDGVRIIKVPTVYMPTKVDMVAFHESAVAAPVDLSEYRTHIDPPGISGWLVEGRIVWDAFIVAALSAGIAAHNHL